MCKIKDFEVLDFCSLFSDIHSPLFLELNCEKVSLEETKSFSTNDTEHIGKWKHEKILEFKGNINTDEVDELFSRLLEKSENLDVVDQNCINVIVDDVTNILLKPAKKMFGVHVNMSKYENNNNNNKDWFNKDLVKGITRPLIAMKTLVLAPSDIMYSQRSIRPSFQNGDLLGDIRDWIMTGQMDVEDLPMISVKCFPGDRFLTTDNRRLWIFKELEILGEVKSD
ncbi:unnamed protein product [Mytilus coruscus]|uniref:Uncharacterized protein n=1 Tax=Mytilus coruscus TaxID=42192 RepID=A0A6J8A9D1_MYTCO|nr:unnamed protein product [Mytilus coruscus]